jgi:glutathione peroxidase
MTTTDRLKLSFATMIFRTKDLFTGGRQMKSKEAGDVHGVRVKAIDGQEKSLGDYKGKVLMIVNTASLCGFTPQYEALEALNKKYSDRGFRVLGFPANDFGAQEPGSDPEIAQFCRTRYSVTFDLFSKITVKGPGIHPLYKQLTASSGEIDWNFTKFLVDRQGRVQARFGPADDPASPKVEREIERLLSA